MSRLVRQHDGADRLEVNHGRMLLDAHVVGSIRPAGIGNHAPIVPGAKPRFFVVTASAAIRISAPVSVAIVHLIVGFMRAPLAKSFAVYERCARMPQFSRNLGKEAVLKPKLFLVRPLRA